MFSYVSSHKKLPYYFISHPHEGYLTGESNYLGETKEGLDSYSAHSYYLPTEVAKFIPIINEYFYNLIRESNVPLERKKWKNTYCSIDMALVLLHRTNTNLKNKCIFLVGSKHISPTTWAIIGNGHLSCRLYRYIFYNLYGIVAHYTRKYEQMCHCTAVSVFHNLTGRENVISLCKDMPSTYDSCNIMMATAICFLKDLIEFAGPDTIEFFDLFTNDMNASPSDVDIGAWMNARAATLDGIKKQYKPSSPAVPYIPKYLKTKVKIFDEGDDLRTNARGVKFGNISMQEDYSYYMQ